jgi:hypothetical protein
MGRPRKQPATKIEPGLIPIVSTNPEQLTNTALKLAAVGSTILIVKTMLDAVPFEGINDWLKAHPNYASNFITQGWFLAGPVGFGLEALATMIPDPIKVGHDMGEHLRKGDFVGGFKAVLEDLGFQAQRAQTALEQAQRAVDDMNANVVTRQNALQRAQEALMAHNTPTNTEARNLASMALDAAIGDAAQAVKNRDALVVQADLPKALAERGRWLVAIVVGTFLATTMIFAGDSVLDLAGGALGGLGLIPKVV